MFQASVNGKEFKVRLDSRNPGQGEINGEKFELDRKKTGKNTFHVLKNNKTYNIEILEANRSAKRYVLLINGRRYETVLRNDLDLLLESMGIGSGASRQTKDVKAPMPGLVLDVLVKEGGEVAKGDPLVILEAMKMENVLKSPADGVVKKVNINKGTAVEKNQVLVSFN